MNDVSAVGIAENIFKVRNQRSRSWSDQ